MQLRIFGQGHVGMQLRMLGYDREGKAWALAARTEGTAVGDFGMSREGTVNVESMVVACGSSRTEPSNSVSVNRPRVIRCRRTCGSRRSPREQNLTNRKKFYWASTTTRQIMKQCWQNKA
ncbi:unnamed protein product [Linum trigynum]|uniref:Uncharacterized protein n=1 Tax=Linum trigynum TaxID=586398 RepID=A0AAV2EJ08_9ROSI